MRFKTSSRRSKAVYIVLVGCLVLCVAGIGLAQNSNSADIRGTATDPSGAVLPEVTVTVLNNDTGVSRVFVGSAPRGLERESTVSHRCTA